MRLICMSNFYLICAALPYVYVLDFCLSERIKRGERGQRGEGALPLPLYRKHWVCIFIHINSKKKQAESEMKHRQRLEHDNYTSSLHNYTCF